MIGVILLLLFRKQGRFSFPTQLAQGPVKGWVPLDDLPLGICHLDQKGKCKFLNSVGASILETLPALTENKIIWQSINNSGIGFLFYKLLNEIKISLEGPITVAGKIAEGVVFQLQGYRTQDKDILIQFGFIDLRNAVIRWGEKKSDSSLPSELSQKIREIVHDIRSPMTAISGFSDLISNCNYLQNQELEFITRIKANSNYAIDLCNSILTREDQDLKHVPVELTQICFDMIAVVQPMCEQKKLTFYCENQSSRTSFISTDSLGLRRVLINLLSNAVKFTQTGHVMLVILDDVDSLQRDQICFIIKDTGIGLCSTKNKSMQPNIQFPEDHSELQSFGLGFGIVEQTVQRLQGEISMVYTAPTLGTCFRLSLPTEPCVI